MRKLLPMLLACAPALLAAGPEFEVASIKPFTPAANGRILIGPGRGGPGSADPTHIVMNAMSLRSMVMTAFDVKSYQVAGPDNLGTLMFDIQAVVPEGATKEQVPLMWRNLLETRFGMKFHIEQREFNVDDLVVGPRGHKLVENTDPPPPPPDPTAQAPLPAPPKMDKDGKPVMTQPGLFMMMSVGPNGGGIVARAMGKAQPISAFTNMLSNQVGHPVVDKTGLTGKYDFYVEFAPTSGSIGLPGPGLDAPRPPQSGTAPDLGLDLATAIQQQLGLRLVGSKGKLDVIVVDKINPTPTDN